MDKYKFTALSIDLQNSLTREKIMLTKQQFLDLPKKDQDSSIKARIKKIDNNSSSDKKWFWRFLEDEFDTQCISLGYEISGIDKSSFFTYGHCLFGKSTEDVIFSVMKNSFEEASKKLALIFDNSGLINPAFLKVNSNGSVLLLSETLSKSYKLTKDTQRAIFLVIRNLCDSLNVHYDMPLKEEDKIYLVKKLILSELED